MIQSRRMTWARHVDCLEDIINAYIIFVGKPYGKRIFGINRREWKDNIKMHVSEVVL
jgi:hypothetical protein